jgi:hypothetical protein
MNMFIYGVLAAGIVAVLLVLAGVVIEAVETYRSGR